MTLHSLRYAKQKGRRNNGNRFYVNTSYRLPSQESLSRLLLFSKLSPDLQRKIVIEMHERSVQAGEILINEGDTGLAASALYVVKSGKFEVR